MTERYTKYTERPASYCIFKECNQEEEPPTDSERKAAKEQLQRFIGDIWNHREPSEADKQAAADALIYAMNGNDLRIPLGMKRKRGERGPLINPDMVALDDPLFGIVCALVREEIDQEKAEQLFSNECETLTGKALDDKTIRKYIDAILPRAKQNVAFERATVPRKKDR